jgi:energy-coupling factor transport system ATP-binding protein
MRIRVEAVSYRYPSGVQALQEVSVSVDPGETVAIVGENGAGKTTLARHLNGLLRPQSGAISIGDWDARQHTVAQLSSRVGYVFQSPDDQLFARSVREEVAFGPKNLGWESGGVRESVDSALAQAGLSESAGRHPYDLSPSERKFVALAATLAMRTPIVILDEPTTGLDTSGVDRLSGIVSALRQAGISLVIISHDLDFCIEHVERAVVMTQGRIVADGAVKEVFQEQDLLVQAQLRQPQLIRLAGGLGIPFAPSTVEEFIQGYRRRRR